VGSKFYFTLLRFYTFDMLDKNVKNRINSLLKKDISVHFVSLLILNYNEFKLRIKIKPEAIFRDLRVILDLILKAAKFGQVDNNTMSIMDLKTGKLSIILPGATDSQSTKISRLLKYKIKQYFINNKVENVFISIGSLSYSNKTALDNDKFSSSRFSIKEIYVDSEMHCFKRIALKTKIKLYLSASRIELAKPIDVSEGWICLVTKNLLKTDTQIKLSFYFSEDKNSVILTQARVAWIKKMDSLPEEINQYKVGLEFVSLEGKFRRIIRRKSSGKL
jgi:hypothetical protein